MQLGMFCDDPTDRLFEIIRRLVHHNGAGEVAHVIGWEVSALSHALSRSTSGGGKRRRYLPIDVLPRLVRLEGGIEIAAYLAELCGAAVVADAPPTPAEELAATIDAINHELGPETRKGLLRAKRAHLKRRRGLYVGGGHE